MAESPRPIGPLTVSSEQPIAVLKIALFASGSVAVKGQIEDSLVAYGMLELARDAIQLHHASAEVSPLLLPPSARVRGKPAPMQPTPRPPQVAPEEQKPSVGDSQQDAG